MKRALVWSLLALAGGSSLAACGDRYFMVNELMAEPKGQVGKTLRVHGYVEPGSIKEAIVGQMATRTFILTREGQRISVYNEGPKPDTFRDQSEVVATGTLTHENGLYTLNAHEISAKCPSKYEGAGANQKLGDPGAHPVGVPISAGSATTPPSSATP